LSDREQRLILHTYFKVAKAVLGETAYGEFQTFWNKLGYNVDVDEEQKDLFSSQTSGNIAKNTNSETATLRNETKETVANLPETLKQNTNSETAINLPEALKQIVDVHILQPHS